MSGEAWPSRLFSGNLYAPRWRETIPVAWATLPGVTLVAESAGWISLEFRSQRPLQGEPAGSGDTYRYHALVRRSGPRFLLACDAQNAVYEILRLTGLSARVFSPVIDVARLVRELAATPEFYALGAVFARVEGYGRSFKSIVMYGSDLADARLFRDVLPRTNPYRASLRGLRTKEDIISVGARGEISFHCRGIQGLLEIDAALRYLSGHQYVNWSVDSPLEGS